MSSGPLRAALPLSIKFWWRRAIALEPKALAPSKPAEWPIRLRTADGPSGP